MKRYIIVFFVFLMTIGGLLIFQTECALSDPLDYLQEGYLITFHNHEDVEKGNPWARAAYWHHMVMYKGDGIIIESDYKLGVQSITLSQSFTRWFGTQANPFEQDHDWNNYAIFGYETSYTDGMFRFSANAGSTWTDYEVYDFCFKTFGYQ